MDRLRALEYLLASAQAKSFSGAARELDVSVNAVAKLIAALEKNLDTQLFDRTSAGLTLTAAGARYMDACGPALTQLADAEEQAREAGARSPGTIVVGVQHVVASCALTRALPRFHARYPEVTLDIREFSRITESETSGIDAFLHLGWLQLPNLVRRCIAAGRFIVVASPEYWRRNGMPRRPGDLARHVCLPIRALDGTVMDSWEFTRGGETETVTASGWLLTANSHRDMVLQLALGGHGVLRMLDWTNLDEIASGLLVQALADWESPEAPPVNLLYRSGMRRNPRVRLFLDFATELFAELEAARGRVVPASGAPYWLGRRYGKSSAMPGSAR